MAALWAAVAGCSAVGSGGARRARSCHGRLALYWSLAKAGELQESAMQPLVCRCKLSCAAARPELRRHRLLACVSSSCCLDSMARMLSSVGNTMPTAKASSLQEGGE